MRYYGFSGLVTDGNAVRVLPEFIVFKLRKRLFGLARKFKSIEAQRAASEAWWDRASPIGKKPFEAVLHYDCFASACLSLRVRVITYPLSQP